MEYQASKIESWDLIKTDISAYKTMLETKLVSLRSELERYKIEVKKIKNWLKYENKNELFEKYPELAWKLYKLHWSEYKPKYLIPYQIKNAYGKNQISYKYVDIETYCRFLKMNDDEIQKFKEKENFHKFTLNQDWKEKKNEYIKIKWELENLKEKIGERKKTKENWAEKQRKKDYAKQVNVVRVAEFFGLKLKKSSGNYACKCVFHHEKTPSLIFFTKTNTFKCFGCGAGGDTIAFVRKILNVSYTEAIDILSKI